MKMTVSEKLLYYRKKAGLSQLELAERLNLSRQAISRWESGAALPSTDNLKCLSGLYGVSVDFLLDDSAEPGEEETARPEPLETKEDGHVLSIPRKWVISLVAAVLLIGIGIGIAIAVFGWNGNSDRVSGDLDALDESTIAPTTEDVFSLEWE